MADPEVTQSAPTPEAQAASADAARNAAAPSLGGAPATPTAAPAPAAGATPAPVAQATQPQDSRNLAQKAVGKIADVFSGGAVKPIYGADADGKIVQTGVQKVNPWAYYLSAALTGMAAGTEAGHNAKGAELMAGIGAGGASAIQRSEQSRDKARGEAVQNQELSQKKKLEDATHAHLVQETATAAWKLTREQAEVSENHVKLESSLENAINENPDNKDLGNFASFDEFTKNYYKDHPEVVQQISGSHGDLQLVALPHYERKIDPKTGQPAENAVYDGVHVALVKRDWMDQKIAEEKSIPVFKASQKPGEPGTWETQTFKAGAITNGEWLKANMAQTSEAAKYDMEGAKSKAVIEHSLAQAADFRANADKAEAEAALLRSSTPKPGAGVPLTPELQQQIDSLDAGKKQVISQYDTNTQSSLMAIAFGHGEVDLNTFPLQPRKGIPGITRSQAVGAIHQLNPEWSEQTYKQIAGAYKQARTKIDPQVSSINTFIGHAAEEKSILEGFYNSQTQYWNKPLRDLSTKLGGEDMTRLKEARQVVNGEFNTMIKAGYAPTAEEIQAQAKISNEDTATPAQISAAINVMANMGHVRANSINEQFKTETGMDYPNLIYAGNQAAARYIGMNITGFRSGGSYGGSGNPPQQRSPQTGAVIPGKTPPAPPPEGAKSVIHDGNGNVYGYRMPDGSIQKAAPVTGNTQAAPNGGHK